MASKRLLFPAFPHFLHGGDYNPDQWPSEVWKEDMRLMAKANCNCMTVGVFSWAQIEPQEGQFNWDWLDTIFDRLHEIGSRVILATPTAAQPPWMSRQYPEVLRVGLDGRRFQHSQRVRWCPSSPIYREKCRAMNRRLAERYGKHPALLLWHLSNEYNSYCYCDLCRKGFQQWLKQKYSTLENLNAQWYTAFWGHTLSDWSEAPVPHSLGDDPNDFVTCHGMHLDWRRYQSERVCDFIRNEKAPLQEITPDIPTTTNLMGFYEALDYWKIAREVDIISWDSYPEPTDQPDMWCQMARTAMEHDLNRSLGGGKPFLLMESSPDSVNWRPYMKLKRPGLHRLFSAQAVAHGADSIQYFQWRKGRGGGEKFHGAVVDHSGRDDTRVFRDVAEVGAMLSKIEAVLGATVQAEVALVIDWENRWAIENIQGPIKRSERQYIETCLEHYMPFWQRGVPVDIVDQTADFEGYRMVIASMPYLLRPGFSDKMDAFVQDGGTFVSTYWCGMVNENDLCFLGGFPGPLREMLGIWIEETDILYDSESAHVRAESGNALGLSGEWEASHICGLPHAESAEVVARYTDQFYAGRPAITVNTHGKGRAWHIAFRADNSLHDPFYESLIREMGLVSAVEALPEGVSAQVRRDEESEFLFLMNFSKETRALSLGGKAHEDMLEGGEVTGNIEMPPYAVKILRRPL